MKHLIGMFLLATATASEELPDSWHYITLAAFTSAAVVSLVLLVTALIGRTRLTWFYPAMALTLLAGSVALGFCAYVYKIDNVALRPPGTEGASTIWRALWIPCLPVLVALAATVIYRTRNNQAQ
jgi:uncharacterized membrane protein